MAGNTACLVNVKRERDIEGQPSSLVTCHGVSWGMCGRVWGFVAQVSVVGQPVVVGLPSRDVSRCVKGWHMGSVLSHKVLVVVESRVSGDGVLFPSSSSSVNSIRCSCLSV